MEKGYTKVNDNIYFRSRKEAAMYDERLSSRERASELLGVSVSSLADYELGNTKVVPVDKVDLMAQLYKAPQLRTQYCKAECPIGKYIPMATELKGIESVVIQLIQLLDESKIEDIKKQLLSVSSVVRMALRLSSQRSNWLLICWARLLLPLILIWHWFR